MAMRIKYLKKGEFFKIKDSEKADVWVRDEYVRELKKYSTYKFNDINHEKLLQGDREVYVGFTF